MRSIEDKGCLSPTPPHEISSNNTINFDFHKANGKSRSSQHRMTLGKSTPSTWDDAQKWLVNLSRGGDKSLSKSEPRNSNADDRRLIAAVPSKEDYSSGEDEERNVYSRSSNTAQCEVETKKVECDDSHWRINKHVTSASVVRSVCVRDMGTEMTPIASQEPSRAATPIRAMTAAAPSPLSFGSSTPVRCQNGVQELDSCQMSVTLAENREEASRNSIAAIQLSRDREAPIVNIVPEKNNSDHQAKKLNPLETRAMAGDEAERAKYMARYK